MTVHKLMNVADVRRAFINTFDSTARYHQRHRVFGDLMCCSAITVHNQLTGVFSDALEQEYLNLVKHYEREDISRMSSLFALIQRALTLEVQDFLGSVFMALELGDKSRAQFFSPWHICRLMAQFQCGDLADLLKTQPFVTASEPACGAAGMIIALAESLREAGYDPGQHLWVSCTDIDTVAASMAYIQLSMLGIPGQVITGNALTLECRRVLYTPAHYHGGWNARLNLYQGSAA